MEIPHGNTMDNSRKWNPKSGFKPPRAEMPAFKWLFLKSLKFNRSFMRWRSKVFFLPATPGL
jgi:hypothetical protein